MMLVSTIRVRCLVFACAACCGQSLIATGMAAEGEKRGRPIVAEIDGAPVYRDEVQRELKSAYGQETDVEQMPADTRQRAAEQVVNRRLVLKYLVETGQGASTEDVTLAIERLRNELKAQGITLTAFFKRGGWEEEDFRRHMLWALSWREFLDRTTTEANLEKYFEQHRADFDGREVRVAHLLLKVDPADEAGRKMALAEAGRIRWEVQSGKLSFADAVRKHSQAPTAEKGGQLGFIGRREPMPESFSKAAFGLAKGEVSQPVVTSFGVHLIQCLEVRPGKLTWRDAEAELRNAVAVYLFDWTAAKQREKVTIRWNRAEPGDAADGESASGGDATAANDKGP